MTIYEKYKRLQEELAMTYAGITIMEHHQQKFAEQQDIYDSTLPGLTYLREEQVKIKEKMTKVEEVIKLVEQIVEEHGL